MDQIRKEVYIQFLSEIGALSRPCWFSGGYGLQGGGLYQFFSMGTGMSYELQPPQKDGPIYKWVKPPGPL